MRNAPACEVRSLRKIYRDPEVVANDGIDFSVELGTSFGLLGPNGAGKTTLVRQLVGLMRPTAGKVLLFGEEVQTGRSSQSVGRHMAYLPQGAFSLGELKVREALQYTAMLRGCGRATARSESESLMEVLELGPLADRQLRKLSGGQRRLTQVAMTLVGRLPVLILDEPTTDIDPELRGRIWTLLAERAGDGAAVILVTHDVAEAEHVLDRVAILHEGRIVAAGRPAELKARLAHRTRIEVVIAEGTTLGDSFLTLLGPDHRVERRRVSAWVAADEAVMTLEKVVSAAGPGALEDVRLITPTLEDVYLELGGHHLKDEE
ncbi:MAG TPA: ABC transporter ATP-binding protein [Actinomycetota bacterium]|nr:ABC transporter ATP-binding protein [Actinomycetota bacterium]